jgi:glyoxalase family protein
VILGLHHVTATVAEAQPDVDFCAGALALRLVKKTVNFDNHSVYHFYYGDERGTPGTIWTTFPYAGMGVPVGTKGVGQITATAFSVPEASLDYWRERLARSGAAPVRSAARFGDEVLALDDPSGLRFELIASRDTRRPWLEGTVDPEAAVRGIHSVTMTVATPEPSVRFMTDVLGLTVKGEEPGRMRVSLGGDGPGHTIDLVYGTGAVSARNGLGTVHHVAMAVDGPETQRKVRETLIERGYQVTQVLDRQYFQSIYFREPGGILFEAATVAPGFTVDEPLDQLGRALRLPPWEEPNRPTIERSLPPVTDPRP